MNNDATKNFGALNDYHCCDCSRMQRKKGQFTSSKPNSDDSASAITSWGSNENLDQDANGSIPQEAV